MVKKQFLSNEQVVELLTTAYGIEVTALTVLALGADSDALVYKACANNGASYFVKLKRGHDHGIGVTIQQLLHAAGIEQIICPINTVLGKPAYYLPDHTLVVYPFIEGHDGFSKNLTDDQWITLGKTLRAIHTFELPASIKDQIKKETYSAHWRDTVRSLLATIETQKTVVDGVALRVLTALKEHKHTIKALVDRAELLSHKVQLHPAEFVLCHGDIHAGNVLLADNGMLYVVDWDDAILACKERDLMFIGAGIGSVWNKAYEEELFYSGYGKPEINKEIRAYYRYERSIQDIAEYWQLLFLTTDGGKDREVMYSHFIALFEPHGVVDSALKP